MPALPSLKLLSQKVAVVRGAPSPVAAILCLKLLANGARLLLGDDWATLRDVNVLFAGLDVNYTDGEGGDPWGAEPVVAQQPNEPTLSSLRAASVAFFGRKPDFVVSVGAALEDAVLDGPSTGKGALLCIVPWSREGIWGRGWLEIGEGENFRPELPQNLSILTWCSDELLRKLNTESRWQELCRGVQFTSSGLFCSSDDFVKTLSYVLHDGKTHQAADFEMLLDDVTAAEGGRCRLCMRAVPLQSLFCPSSSQAEEKCEMGEMTEIRSESEEDGLSLVHYDSDFSNGTFDTLLQKAKDYPIDWWQGGSECCLSMGDITYKGMTRAVINFAVRWLVLGYLVIGFAVPKALGLDAP